MLVWTYMICKATSKHTKPGKVNLRKSKKDLALKRSLMTRTNTDHFIYTILWSKVVSELRKAKTRHLYKLIEANGKSFKLWQP